MPAYAPPWAIARGTPAGHRGLALVSRSSVPYYTSPLTGEPLPILSRRWNCADVRDDRTEIRRGDALIPGERHRHGKPSAVRADAVDDRALDLSIAPVADAVLRIRGDVA